MAHKKTILSDILRLKRDDLAKAKTAGCGDGECRLIPFVIGDVFG
jgi:hypothetical protein